MTDIFDDYERAAEALDRANAEIDHLRAYLRTLANFGGTVQQARDLAAKALSHTLEPNHDH